VVGEFGGSNFQVPSSKLGWIRGVAAIAGDYQIAKERCARMAGSNETFVHVHMVGQFEERGRVGEGEARRLEFGAERQFGLL